MQTTFGYRRQFRILRSYVTIPRVSLNRQDFSEPRYRAARFHHKVSAVLFALVASALVAVLSTACGGGPGAAETGGSESDTFTLTGPTKADSSAEKGQAGSCEWTPALFNLKFASGKMQNGVQVKFDVTVGPGGVGDLDATSPAASDGSTPLQLMVAGKPIKAAEGTVHVTDADLGARKWKGSLDATFTDGTKISGTWTCVAP